MNPHPLWPCMRSVLFAGLVAATMAAGAKDAGDGAAAERARIAAERSQVEAQYHAEERACWGRFGVNGCLAGSRAKRRAALADLRRQEISLNDAERKQRAAQRLRSIEERPAPAAPPPPKIRDRRERDAKAAQRAAEQAAREADHARRAQAKPPADDGARVADELARREAERASRAERAAANVRRREALQQEASKRQEALQRRLAARHKPPAAPLPAPP